MYIELLITHKRIEYIHSQLQLGPYSSPVQGLVSESSCDEGNLDFNFLYWVVLKDGKESRQVWNHMRSFLSNVWKFSLGTIWYAMQRWYDKWWSKWHEEWWMGRMWGSAPGVEAPHCDDGVSLAIMTPRNFTLYTESDLFLQQAHNQRFRIIALPLDLSGSQVWVCPPTYLQFEMHEIFTYPRLWRCCWHGWTDQRD